MADTKISALSAVSAVAGGNEFAVNESGTSKKASATQIADFINAPNKALSNLASVSINLSLIPQTTIDLGAAGTPWRDIYLYGGGSFGSHSIKLTGTPTGNRVITIPNVTDTLAVLGTAQTFTQRQAVTLGSALADGQNALAITATMPTTITATNAAIDYQITSAGSSSFSQVAVNHNLLVGYTGSSSTSAGNYINAAAGTGTGTITGSRNFGIQAQATSTTTGTNIGLFASGTNGDKSIGVVGRAVTAKNSATNIGVFGAALNTGTTPIQVGGYFALTNAEPTFTSAALIADNGGTTSPIFVARDNGTAVFTIADGGAITTTSSITTAAPTGGAGAWKLGVAAVVSPTAPNRTVAIDIGGTTYYLHAKTTNN